MVILSIVSGPIVLIQALRYGCLSGFDMGIFPQVVQGAWQGDWNPFVPVRELFVVQDHWDYVTVLVAKAFFPAKWFFSPAVFLILFEYVVFCASAIWTYCWFSECQRDQRFSWLAFLIVSFSAMTWSALHFPVHPTTWAILGLLGIVFWSYAYIQDSQAIGHKLLWASSFWIWICSEQFSVGLVAFSAVLMIYHFFVNKKVCWRKIAFFFFCVLGLWWAWVGRHQLMGPVFDYSGRVSFKVQDWISYYPMSRQLVVGLAKGLIVFVPFCYFTMSMVSLRLFFSVNSIGFLSLIGALFGPLILGRFLANNWGVHYGVVLVPLSVATLCYVLVLNIKSELTRKSFSIFCGLILFSSLSYWGKGFHFISTPSPVCAPENRATKEDWENRLVDLAEIERLAPKNSRALVGMFLAPRLIQKRLDVEVHTLGPYRPRDSSAQFDLVCLSTGEFNNNWPISSEQVDRLEELISNRIVYRGKTVICAKGVFSANEFREFASEQVYR